MALPEVRNYTLTMNKLDKWAAASRNVIPYQKALGDKINSKPDPPANLPHTMEAMANWTRKHYPTHVQLVERAGITFKEYLIISFALSAATAVSAMAERGVQPPQGTFINKENVQFVKTNKEKITAMYAEFQNLLVGRK